MSGSAQKHIVIFISGHGYGHMAMTAPVVNYLAEKRPALRITIVTTVPETVLRNKITTPFEYIYGSSDFGLIMNSAFDIDLDASLQAYRKVHSDWDSNLDKEIKRLKTLEADLVLSNIGYLPLAAAKALNIPCIAMCCLNWADIFSYYFHEDNEQKQIHQQMLDAYRGVDLFIRPEPAMPMPDLKTTAVGPLALLGENVRTAVLDTLSLAPQTKLILTSMGGIHTQVDCSRWPQMENVHYLHAGASASTKREDITSTDDLSFSFSQLLRSCDLFLTKPGYGSFAEAARYSVPILYVHRDNWPEQPYLIEWIKKHTIYGCITLTQFETGEFMEPLKRLISTPNRLMPPSLGTETTYRLICQLI